MQFHARLGTDCPPWIASNAIVQDVGARQLMLMMDVFRCAGRGKVPTRYGIAGYVCTDIRRPAAGCPACERSPLSVRPRSLADWRVTCIRP